MLGSCGGPGKPTYSWAFDSTENWKAGEYSKIVTILICPVKALRSIDTWKAKWPKTTQKQPMIETK